jgi:hypothetical protein
MRFWIGLYAELDREMLINGVNTMLKVAAEILIPNGSDEDMQKQLKHGGQHGDEDHIRICKRLKGGHGRGTSVVCVLHCYFLRPGYGL